MIPTATIPILITGDIPLSIREYKALGFDVDDSFVDQGYLIASLDAIELHLSLVAGLDPAANACACYIRTARVTELHETWHRSIASENGIPRLTIPEEKPWGMLEFALVDSTGNLIRVGQPLE
jgi:hypothetical protein